MFRWRHHPRGALGGVSTLTLLNDVSGLTVNLAQGDNTLNLAAGTNSLDNLFNIGHLNGSASDDSLTVAQQPFGTVFDMDGGNDTINFGGQTNGVTVANTETVNGSAQNDVIGEQFQRARGILSPLRLPIPPCPLDQRDQTLNAPPGGLLPAPDGTEKRSSLSEPAAQGKASICYGWPSLNPGYEARPRSGI